MSQFRLQYSIFGLILLVGLLLWNKVIKTPKWALILCLLIVIINLLQVLPWIKFDTAQRISSKGDIKVELINVLTSNEGYKAVLDNINTFKPNVIFLEEVNSEWLNNMSALDKSYPYSIKKPRDDNFGVALYSNIPLKTKEINYLGHFDIPSITCIINVKNRKVRLIGIHTTPPKNQDYFINRNEMLSELSDAINKDKTPTVVIGDLNTTMYSPTYKKLIRTSKLMNPRKMFGINPSWSPKCRAVNGISIERFLKFMIIPIDQVLYTQGIKINHFKVGKSIGSDHLPIEVSLIINK